MGNQKSNILLSRIQGGLQESGKNTAEQPDGSPFTEESGRIRIEQTTSTRFKPPDTFNRREPSPT